MQTGDRKCQDTKRIILFLEALAVQMVRKDMFADRSGAIAADTWCRHSVNRCQVSWSSRKLWLLRLVSGNSTVEVETMGKLAGL